MSPPFVDWFMSVSSKGWMYAGVAVATATSRNAVPQKVAFRGCTVSLRFLRALAWVLLALEPSLSMGDIYAGNLFSISQIHWQYYVYN